MELFTIFLLFVILLQIKSFISAIIWIGVRGDNYIKDLETANPSKNIEFYELWEKHKGNFFPFGFKDYKLRRFKENLNIDKSKYNPLRIIINIFQGWFYRFIRFTLIIFIYLFAITNLKRELFLSINFHLYLLISLTILLIFTYILASIEHTYSFIKLRGYAYQFHMLKGDKITELKVMLHRLLGTIMASTISFYVAHIYYNALGGEINNFNPSSFLNNFIILFQCAYFSLSTLLTVGFGDIFPTNLLGQGLTFLLEVQSFALLTVVLSVIFSSQPNKGQC